MESNVKWVTHNNATVTVLVKFREPTITPWCFGCHVISNDIVRDLKHNNMILCPQSITYK